MNILEYIDVKKELYSNLLLFLENEDESDTDFEKLIRIFENQKIKEDPLEFQIFLNIISNISSNHHRSPYLFTKIFQILSFFLEEIKQNVTSSELVDIFKKSKPIILFFLTKKIILINEIIDQNPNSEILSDMFFYPELKSLNLILLKNASAKYFNNNNPFDLEKFEENRQIGENDLYICHLIRNDMVKEFIAYVNRTNYRLSTPIQTSIFETNSFLIKKPPTVIEYAAFFGSVQIFQYLLFNNNIKIDQTLWLYAIHSQNPSIIHLLEDNQIKPTKQFLERIIKESIKCHHNDITNYILYELMNREEYNELDDFLNLFDTKADNEICRFKYALKYYNFAFFPSDFNNNFILDYLCSYNYIKIVKFFIDYEKFLKSDIFFLSDY